MSVQPSSHPVLSGADSAANVTSDFLLLVSRILLGWIFVRSGYGKMLDIPAFAAGLPRLGIPSWLAYVGAPAEFFGGVALIIGLATRYAVLLLVAFLLVATFSAHRYWDFTDMAQRRMQEMQFGKNIAVLGGFLALFVAGPGRFSIDGWLRRTK